MSSTPRHRVFGSLYRACPDDLPGGLRLEYRRFLCKRIDALPRLCGGRLGLKTFLASGHKKGSPAFSVFVNSFGDRLCEGLDGPPPPIIPRAPRHFLSLVSPPP